MKNNVLVDVFKQRAWPVRRASVPQIRRECSKRDIDTAKPKNVLMNKK